MWGGRACPNGAVQDRARQVALRVGKGIRAIVIQEKWETLGSMDIPEKARYVFGAGQD
jgi:hypothetical protein